jgi:hypothetical protein
VHSVTRTPVDERYRVERGTIVQTRLRFEQHGPGLPTEADAGGTWTREGGAYVVTMERRLARSRCACTPTRSRISSSTVIRAR